MKARRGIVPLDLFLVFTVLLAAIAFSRCGKRESPEDEDAENPAPNSAAAPVDANTAGTVTGVVKFEGAAPRMKNINMSSVPSCASMHPTPAVSEDVVVGDNDSLENAVVYLKGDFRQYSFSRPADAVKVDQNGCMYAPHVVALMTGQQLEVTNSDTATHNVNALSSRRQGWNQTQAPASAPIERTFSREEIPIAVKCNVHPWMKFYAAVFSHPYFQVTGKDGAFVMKNVPPGTYTLTVWHELYGTKEQTIVVKPNSEQQASFTFSDHDHR